jgi:hypothetical protein
MSRYLNFAFMDYEDMDEEIVDILLCPKAQMVRTSMCEDLRFFEASVEIVTFSGDDGFPTGVECPHRVDGESADLSEDALHVNIQRCEESNLILTGNIKRDELLRSWVFMIVLREICKEKDASIRTSDQLDWTYYYLHVS